MKFYSETRLPSYEVCFLRRQECLCWVSVYETMFPVVWRFVLHMGSVPLRVILVLRCGGTKTYRCHFLCCVVHGHTYTLMTLKVFDTTYQSMWHWTIRVKFLTNRSKSIQSLQTVGIVFCYSNDLSDIYTGGFP